MHLLRQMIEYECINMYRDIRWNRFREEWDSINIDKMTTSTACIYRFTVTSPSSRIQCALAASWNMELNLPQRGRYSVRYCWIDWLSVVQHEFNTMALETCIVIVCIQYNQFFTKTKICLRLLYSRYMMKYLRIETISITNFLSQYVSDLSLHVYK